MIARAVAGILATIVCIGGALAQQPAQTYKSLLTQGFEVKAVVFIPADATTRLGSGGALPDSVLITLQKGPTVATCWQVFVAFKSQSAGDGACDVLR